MPRLVFANCLCGVVLTLLPLSLPAAPVPVRHIEGTLRGFLALRNPEGKLLAVGDMVQTVRSGLVTERLAFHYQDGSLDDETTVFSQRGTFRLITDHHIQKGPAFPHPMDLSIDTRSGVVTVHTTGKDGKDAVITQHLSLPPDLVNGMIGIIARNISPTAPETDVAMLVTTPKPRVVTLAITAHGEDPLTLAGSQRKALHYSMKIALGGVVGMVAPWVGKQPPDIQVWVIGGDAPTFIRSQSILFEDGPVMTIEQIVPEWPR